MKYFEIIICIALILFAIYLSLPLFLSLLQLFALGFYSVFIDVTDWFKSTFLFNYEPSDNIPEN